MRVGGSRAAFAGLLFAALYAIAFVVLRRIPDSETVGADVVAYLLPIAGISLLWFTAALRHRVASMAGREDALLSTVQLLSAAVYVAMLFVATAVLTAPTIGVESGAIETEAVVSERSLLVVGDTILVVFALRAAGVFIAAGTTRALRSGLIPRWFAGASYVLVLVLLLTVARARAFSLLVPAWVATMSVVVLRRRGVGQASAEA